MGNDSADDRSTWSFVQMNMQLLPIARPLPASVAAHRLSEGAALAGVKQPKPRTPTLSHKRPLERGISPRPPSAIVTRFQEQQVPRSRAGSEDWSAYPAHDVSRLRSYSDDLVAPPPSPSHGLAASDRAKSSVRAWSPYLVRHTKRPASESGTPKGQFKGKRILELQDEDRRLLPGEGVVSASPTKKSRRHL